MSSPPPEKKLKTSNNNDAGAPTTTSWRTKCIEKFNLQPAPKGWEKSVAIGSEDAWKRYYTYRVDKEKNDPRNSSSNYDDSDDEDEDDEDNWQKEAMEMIMYTWAESESFGMGKLTSDCMLKGCKWQWTPQQPNLEWEEEDKLRSADYYAHVWSPYAIPHAIKLTHSWYGKVGWSSYDLAVDWNYMLLDFEEDVGKQKQKYVEICSNNYDVIKTKNLNKTTCNKLRKHLYGASTEQSKLVTCSDRDFWLLIFGSMGSHDKELMEDAKDCSLGYSWCPWKEDGMKQKLFDEKANVNDDVNGEAPTDIKKYSPRWCSWLRYRIMEVTDTIGPISKYYKPPSASKKSSPGHDSDEDGDSYGGGY